MFEGLEKLEVPRSGHPRARRVFKVGVVLAVVFSLVVGVIGFVVYRKVNSNLMKGQDASIEVIEQALPDGPLNILVLGSDRRDVVEASERNKRQFKGEVGQRADTIILLHLNPVTNKAVLVSFPRDLRVRIPGHGTQKINSAYAIGGPNLVIQTVSQFSGLDVNHYVEVNFASFREIVEAVGGVSVYVNRRMVDKRSGLNLPKPGCYVLDGDMALSFVRARYIDPTADIGRIQRQQLFLRTLMAKVKSIGFILNIGRVLALSKAVGNGLRYDTGVDLGLARAVASRLAGFDQRRVDFRIVPGDNAFIGGGSYIVARERESAELFAAIAADTELPPYGKTTQSVPEPRDVTVKLLNGTGQTGYAGQERTRLSEIGYRVQDIGTTEAREETVIVYSPEAKLKAELIARTYAGAELQVATAPQSADVVVMIGKEALAPPASPGASPGTSPKPTKKPQAPKTKAATDCA